MYFDFEDGHPDLPRVPSALTAREGVMLSIIVHLVIALAAVLVPRTEWWQAREAARRQAVEVQPARVEPPREQPRFVFMQPQVEVPPQRPVEPRAPLSDRDRTAMTRERAPVPANPQPFSRGNTPEYVEPGPRPSPPRAARDPGPVSPPTPQAPPQSQARADTPGQSPDALRLPDGGRAPASRPDEPVGGSAAPANPSLGQALRELSRYAEQAARENPNGGGTSQFGFQFDSKGVEFGPWLRRFAARVRSNWYSIMPQTARYLKGHVVITFNVQRTGGLTELAVIGPSDVDSFNNAAFNALAMSNPADPLPVEYPSDRLLITVTFYYNEQPPSQ